ETANVLSPGTEPPVLGLQTSLNLSGSLFGLPLLVATIMTFFLPGFVPCFLSATTTLFGAPQAGAMAGSVGRLARNFAPVSLVTGAGVQPATGSFPKTQTLIAKVHDPFTVPSASQPLPSVHATVPGAVSVIPSKLR